MMFVTLVFALMFTSSSARYGWDEIDKITRPPNPDDLQFQNGAGARFGTAVSVDGNWMAVGVQEDDVGRGLAYLYSREEDNPGNWTYVRTISPDETDSNVAAFGISIAIRGNLVVVGSHFYDIETAGDPIVDAGAVFVYKVDDDSFEVKLTAEDAADTSPIAIAYFGQSVAVDPPFVVVGAPFHDFVVADGGAVYVYKLNDAGTDFETGVTLIPDTAANFDFFGTGVDIDGTRLVGGAPGLNNRGGAFVYVTNDDGATWELEQVLTTIHARETDDAGQSVGLHKDTIVLGAKRTRPLNFWPFNRDDESSRSIRTIIGNMVRRLREFFTENTGTAYVFTLQGEKWEQTDRLRPPFQPGARLFGSVVTVRDERILVGAPNGWRAYRRRSDAGEVFVFGPGRFRDGKWRRRAIIKPFDVQDEDNFGFDVSYSNGTMAIGSPDEDSNGVSAGAIYMFYKDARVIFGGDEEEEAPEVTL